MAHDGQQHDSESLLSNMFTLWFLRQPLVQFLARAWADLKNHGRMMMNLSSLIDRVNAIVKLKQGLNQWP